MSNFLIFKAAFNNSATPAIGTYTAEGATAQFNKNTSISPDYYLYNTANNTAVQWFVPTAETADFEFVADILTRNWSNNVTYFIIADSTGTTRLRMWSVYTNWHFENSDSTGTSGPEYIGVINPDTSGGFGVFHQFRVRVRKLTESSSSVEVYVDGALKLTATAGAALVTCAKIGFVGGVGTFGPGTGAGIKNAYAYDLSGGEVIDRGVLSGAFNRFISWMKSKFALKSDIPTVNNATLTIQQNGTNVQTFTANASTNATANIQCVDLSTAQTVAGNKTLTGTTSFTSSPGIARNTDPFLLMTTNNYDKGTAPASDLYGGVRFLCNPNAAVTDKITGGFYAIYAANGYNSVALNARNYDENGNNRFFSASLRVPNASALPPDFVPSVSQQINLGSSAAQWNNAYVKALTVNGVAAGDILTHNASEFVPVSGGAVIAGNFLARTVNNSQLDLSGGTGWGNGASISMHGKDDGGALYMYATDGTYTAGLDLSPSGTATLYNNGTTKNIATQEDTVPRSGGAVMTHYELGRNTNTSEFRLCGGTSYANGGSVVLYGKDNADPDYKGRISLFLSDGSITKNMQMLPSGTWTWNGTAVQITSDQRLKQQISEIDDKLLDAWESVELCQFKYNDAVDAKKDKARLHTGYVVQQIDKACKEHNVDISAYGLYCHEEYPQETEEVEVEQADGTKKKETKVIREASEHYSLRYTEAYAIECKYLRRCIKQLTTRIEQLTARIEELGKDKEQEASK